MLVLSRKKNETIILNAGEPNEVRILCVDVGGGKTRIGIEAPKEFTIVRGELEHKDKVAA